MGLLDRLRLKRDDISATAEVSEEQTAVVTADPESVEIAKEQLAEIEEAIEVDAEAPSVSVSKFGALRQAAQQAKSVSTTQTLAAGVDGLADIEAGEVGTDVQQVASDPAPVSATLVIAAQRYAAALEEVGLTVPVSVIEHASLNFSDYVTFEDLHVDTELILAARARRDHLRQTGEPVPAGITHLAGLDPWAYLLDGQRREDFEQS